MRKQTIHFVIFWAPGSFVAEEWKRGVGSADPRKVVWPDNAYAFRLFKREDVIDGDKTYEGKPEQLGPTYYHPDSVVQSLDEARTNPKATSTLISNMECHRWAQIIWTRWMNWPQPFNPETMQVLPMTEDMAQKARAELEEMRQHGNADDVQEAAAHLARVEHEAGSSVPDGVASGSTVAAEGSNRG